MKRSSYLAASAFALPLLARAQASAASFQFTSLAYPGAVQTTVNAINASDQVVGNEGNNDGYQVGFYWSNGTFTAVPNTYNFAAINDNGLIGGAGNNYVPSQYITYDIGSGTQTTNNISLPGNVYVSGVDAAGDVEGFAAYGAKHEKTTYTGFIISNGTLQTLLPPEQTQSIVFAGNQAGTLAIGLEKNKGYVLQNGTYKAFSLPGITLVQPGMVSASGVVGGYAENPHTKLDEGFTAKGKKATAVVYPGAYFTAVAGIGPAGQIVGSYFFLNKPRQSFVLYKGVYTTLKYPGASSTTISGMNAKGSIIGTYVDSAGAVPFIATCASKVCTK